MKPAIMALTSLLLASPSAKHVGLSGIVTGSGQSNTAPSSRSTTNYGTLPGTGGQFGGAMVAGPFGATYPYAPGTAKRQAKALRATHR